MDRRAAEGACISTSGMLCTNSCTSRSVVVPALGIPHPFRSNPAHAAALSSRASARQAFLDQRGEEYDDWFDKDALIVKAQECEVNTGRAADPPRSQPEDTQVILSNARCASPSAVVLLGPRRVINPQRDVRHAG